MVLCWAMAIIVLCVAVYMKVPKVVSFLASAVRTNHLQIDGAHQGYLSWTMDMMEATWTVVGYWGRMVLWMGAMAAIGGFGFQYAHGRGFHRPFTLAFLALVLGTGLEGADASFVQSDRRMISRGVEPLWSPMMSPLAHTRVGAFPVIVSCQQTQDSLMGMGGGLIASANIAQNTAT